MVDIVCRTLQVSMCFLFSLQLFSYNFDVPKEIFRTENGFAGLFKLGDLQQYKVVQEDAFVNASLANVTRVLAENFDRNKIENNVSHFSAAHKTVVVNHGFFLV